MSRILEYDPVTKRQQVFETHADGRLTVFGQQDVTDILELSQAEYNSIDERARWKDGMNHVGRIPLEIVDDLMRCGIWYDDAALERWLDDPANRKWRVRPGRLRR